MGYEIYVTRADSHLDTQQHPIPEVEWLAVSSRDASLCVSTHDYLDHRSADGRIERVYPWRWTAHPDKPPLWFIEGALRAKSPDKSTVSKLVQLAHELGARVIGEDGEEYVK